MDNMLKAEADAYENAIGIVKAGGADEEIYIKAHSDVGRPLTGQSLTGLHRAQREALQGDGIGCPLQ